MFLIRFITFDVDPNTNESAILLKSSNDANGLREEKRRERETASINVVVGTADSVILSQTRRSRSSTMITRATIRSGHRKRDPILRAGGSACAEQRERSEARVK